MKLGPVKFATIFSKRIADPIMKWKRCVDFLEQVKLVIDVFGIPAFLNKNAQFLMLHENILAFILLWKVNRAVYPCIIHTNRLKRQTPLAWSEKSHVTSGRSLAIETFL